MTMQTVTETLADYLDQQYHGKRDLLPQETFTTVGPAGSRCFLLSEIRREEVDRFARQLDAMLSGRSEAYRALYVKHAVSLLSLMRAVACNTRFGFGGAAGVGSQLNCAELVPQLFADPDDPVRMPRSSWKRRIGEVRTLSFIDVCGSTEEGLAILGFSDAADRPLASWVQVEAAGIIGSLQSLDFLADQVAPSGPERQDKLDRVPAYTEKDSVSIHYPEKGTGGSLAEIVARLEAKGGLPTIDAKEEGANALLEALQAMGSKIQSLESRIRALGAPRSQVLELAGPVYSFCEHVRISVQYTEGGIDELRPIGLCFRPCHKLVRPDPLN